MLRKMFALGKIWGFLDGENPATGIERFKEHKRDRFLSPNEMPRFFVALRDEPNVYVRAALLTTLLLGLRRGEALTLRWNDVDLDQGLVRIPKTKADRPHLLPLPQPVVELFRGLPRLHGNEYVFPGRHGNGHLVNVGKNWRRIRAQADLQDVRIHDLRRTLGSWLVGRGASLPLIGKVLNHSQASSTAVYARLDLGPVRRALQENAETMLKLEHAAPLTQSTEEGHA
jgi:integrase